MSDAWIRFGRVLVSLALGGWFTALLVMVPDDSWTLAEAAFSMAALKAATAGAVTGILFSPILVFRRMPAWVGAPMGLLAGLGGIWFFFFLWPHDWQAGRLNADKSLGLFLSVYWRSLLPTFLAVGVATTAWCQRPVRPPRWMRVPEPEPDRPEEAMTEMIQPVRPPDP